MSRRINSPSREAQDMSARFTPRRTQCFGTRNQNWNTSLRDQKQQDRRPHKGPTNCEKVAVKKEFTKNFKVSSVFTTTLLRSTGRFSTHPKPMPIKILDEHLACAPRIICRWV